MSILSRTAVWFVASICVLATLAIIGCSSDANGPERRPDSATISPGSVSAELVGSNCRLDLGWKFEPQTEGCSYDVYLGKSNSPELVASELHESHCSAEVAVDDTLCYWRVVVRDGAREVLIESPLWMFEIRRFYQYPLAQGTIWQYEGSYKLINFDPDSLEEMFPFFVDRTSTVTVDGLQTTPGGVETIRLHETLVESYSTGEEATFESDQLFRNEKRALYNYGYYGASGSSAVPKIRNTGHYLFKSRSFSSIGELVRCFVPDDDLEMNSLASDTVYNEPPNKSLQYPPIVGATWTYKQAGNPWRIDKEIVSAGEVEVAAGTFWGFEVAWHQDVDADGEFDSDIAAYDEIGYEGLLSRRVEIYGIVAINEFWEPIGTFDIVNEWELTSLTVPPDVPSEVVVLQTGEIE